MFGNRVYWGLAMAVTRFAARLAGRAVAEVVAAAVAVAFRWFRWLTRYRPTSAPCPPRLAFRGEESRALVEACPSLMRGYDADAPRWLARCPALQTMLAGTAARREVMYSERVRVGDGALDVASCGREPLAAAVIFPPTASDSGSPHVLMVARALLDARVDVFVANRRGHGGLPLPPEGPAGFPVFGEAEETAALLVRAAAERCLCHTGAGGESLPLALVGLSAGTAEPLRALAGLDPATRVVAVAMVSSPYDVSAVTAAGGPRLESHLCASLERLCGASSADRTLAGLADSCGLPRDCPTRRAEILSDLADPPSLAVARCPTLLLAAADDPLIPAVVSERAHALATAGRHPRLVSALTVGGGHLGWLGRDERGRWTSWGARAAAEFVVAAASTVKAPAERGAMPDRRPRP